MHEPLHNILNEIRNCDGLYVKCQLYGVLLKREGINYEINGTTGIYIYINLHLYIYRKVQFLYI